MLKEYKLKCVMRVMNKHGETLFRCTIKFSYIKGKVLKVKLNSKYYGILFNNYIKYKY